MGAYLSSPVTDKEVYEAEGPSVKYGVSAMQGWRRTMEDAHLAEALGDEKDMCLFGVFDGHGGSEVARFCQRYMSEEFLRLTEQHGIEEALSKVFHRMDDMLRDAKFQEELEQYKMKSNADENNKDDENGSMDALDLLKRVFQLKRFVGGNESSETPGGASGEGPAANGASIDLDEGPADPDESMVQSGCTAIVAVKKGKDLYVANAGDSRGVLCRGNQAVSLSEDHKPAQDAERSRIIAAGGFLSEIGGVCRVNGNLNLSRAIGDLKYKSNSELQPKDQIITAQPDVMKVAITPEDRFFVLACDGVWDVLTNQDVVDFVSSKLEEGMRPQQAACALLDRCLANDPKEARGVGCDNMTAVIVELKPDQMSVGSASTGERH